MIDWRHWHNEPFLTGGLILAGWLYAILAGPLRPRLAPGRPLPPGAGRALFYSGARPLLPGGRLAAGPGRERFLLSAHMVQHLLIMYPVPLLILLGIPAWMVDPSWLPPRLRAPLRLLFHP
jgi:putative membrane protein